MSDLTDKEKALLKIIEMQNDTLRKMIAKLDQLILKQTMTADSLLDISHGIEERIEKSYGKD